MDDIVWPMATTGLMLLSFWFGKFKGFADGWGVGYDEGADAVGPAVARAVLRWVRIDKDINLSDPEIDEVVANINIDISPED